MVPRVHEPRTNNAPHEEMNNIRSLYPFISRTGWKSRHNKIVDKYPTQTLWSFIDAGQKRLGKCQTICLRI
jgi:hypothetical protein